MRQHLHILISIESHRYALYGAEVGEPSSGKGQMCVTRVRGVQLPDLPPFSPAHAPFPPPKIIYIRHLMTKKDHIFIPCTWYLNYSESLRYIRRDEGKWDFNN